MLRYHLRTVSNLRALWQRSEESASPDINKSLSIQLTPSTVGYCFKSRSLTDL